MKELEDLPSNDNEYWKEAEKHTITMPKPPKCSHFFYRRSGKEVECKYCHAGFYLDVSDIIKDGHILRDGQLIL